MRSTSGASSWLGYVVQPIVLGHLVTCALAVRPRQRPTRIPPMDLPDSRSPQAGWLRQCALRLMAFWPAKMIGTTIGMIAFFFVYLWVLRHPSSPPTLMPVMLVDQWIGFFPAALPVYFSLWIYVSLAPALLDNSRELLGYVAAAVAQSAIGLGIFFLWPTAVLPLELEWSRYPGFAFLKTIDASGNACPSLHVAFAILAAAWIRRTLSQTGAGVVPRLFNWLWCLGIIYSTIATRQHVFLDVVAGAVLGSGVALVSIRRFREPR
jgi:membrane-associated phospholipid phosphatase